VEYVFRSRAGSGGRSAPRWAGLALALTLVVAACAPPQPYVAPTPAALSATAAQPADAEIAAVRDVIRRANEQQVQAIVTRDHSPMAELATTEHYAELVRINESLLRGGVTAIALLDMDWGQITVNGSTADAIVDETWSTTYSDGTVEQSRDRNVYTLTRVAGAWKIATNDHPDTSAAPAPSAPVAPSVPATTPAGHDTSRNWSGYAATGGTFTSVSATWTVPRPDPSSPAGAEATWVGIGGVTTRDLIQAGTSTTVSGSGRTQYQAWYEMLPAASRPVPLAIYPGDSVSITVAETTTDNWVARFVNNTTGQMHEQSMQYASSRSSAEWVEEAPSTGRRIVPLNAFGLVEFTQAVTVRDGNTVTLAQANAYPITMIGASRQALAVPSPLGADGQSFSVARTDAVAPQQGTGRRGR
jgi:hypothetical protein